MSAELLANFLITLAIALQGKGFFGGGFDISRLLCGSNRLEAKWSLYTVPVQEAETTWSFGATVRFYPWQLLLFL